MAIDFPSSPTDGQVFDTADIRYTYNLAKDHWVVTQYNSATGPQGDPGPEGPQGPPGPSGTDGTDATFTVLTQAQYDSITPTAGELYLIEEE